jgi:DNA polymerase III subunit epsilon
LLNNNSIEHKGGENMSGKRGCRPDGGANLYSLQTSYIAVDTETTGKDFRLCDIIEIGAVS